jgi:hypothetical protein
MLQEQPMIDLPEHVLNVYLRLVWLSLMQLQPLPCLEESLRRRHRHRLHPVQKKIKVK